MTDPGQFDDLTETLVIDAWELINANLNDDNRAEIITDEAMRDLIDNALRIGIATALKHQIHEDRETL